MNQPATDTVYESLKSALAIAAGKLGRDLGQETLIVAVSGGPDSLALLRGLRQQILPRQLVVAHLDHQLRPESTTEAAYVAELAEQWGHPFIGDEVDVGQLAARKSLTLEEAARLARYGFLANTAAAHDARVVVTGHHRGDQAETVLMHIIRGSGLGGLRGMEALSPLPGRPELLLWRPLLEVDGTTLSAACAEQGLKPVNDPSNDDPRFLRNRIRHELLPLLKEMNSQIESRLTTLAEVAGSELDLLAGVVDDAWRRVMLEEGNGWARLDWQAWQELPLVLRRATLRRAIERAAPETTNWSFRALESYRDVLEQATTGTQIDMAEGMRLSLQYGVVELTAGRPAPARPVHPAPQLPTAAEYPLLIPGRVALQDGWTITARPVVVETLAELTHNRNRWLAIVAQSEQPLLVRPRLLGERFPPLGLGGHYAKIQAMMIDRKIPAQLRPLWPIVAAQHEPIWVVGLAMAEGWRLQEAPVAAVELRCMPGE